MKKVIMTILALCMLSTSVFAGTYLPSNTREYRENDKDYIVKAYEVAETNENEFERNVATTYKDGLKVYKLDNISKSGGTTTTSKEETQIKVVETDSNNIEDVLPLFPSEIEYTEDDEFFGSLKLDTSSIVTTKISDGSYYRRYNVTDFVEYRNYTKNDMDKIPKVRTKNGVQLHLVSVDWKVQNTQMIGKSQVPVSYIATAYYKGTGSQKVAGQAKYTSSATYKGTIEKTEIKPLEYEVSYVKVADYTVWIIISAILGILGVAFILIAIIQNIIRKRNKKKTSNDTRRYY